MPFCQREQQFSPPENNAQVEAGFAPPGSYTCAKVSGVQKSHLRKSAVTAPVCINLTKLGLE